MSGNRPLRRRGNATTANASNFTLVKETAETLYGSIENDSSPFSASRNSIPALPDEVVDEESGDRLEKEEECNKKSKGVMNTCCCSRTTYKKKHGFIRRFADGMAATSVVSSLATLSVASKDSHLARSSSTLSCCMGLYIPYQNCKHEKLGTLRKQNNILRQHTNNFMRENDELSHHVTQLDQSVYRLEGVENEISQLVGGKQSNVRRTVELIKAQKAITRRIKEKLKAQVVHTVLSAVLTSDKNGDFRIGSVEMESLIVRIRFIDGIEVDEKKFKGKLIADGGESGLSLSAIMDLFRSLMNEENEDIFRICPENMR